MILYRACLEIGPARLPLTRPGSAIGGAAARRGAHG